MPLRAGAQADAAAHAWTVRGQLLDAANGARLAGASVTLETADGTRLASTSTDRSGIFALRAAGPGRYTIAVTAAGYLARTALVDAGDRDTAPVKIELTRRGELREIGHLVARGTTVVDAAPLALVNQDMLAAAGSLRVADALKNVPGVTVSGDALAPGGDAYVSLRGLRPAESEVLLDGHPVGPIGVRTSAADADGTIAGFNFQDAPYFALRAVNVAFAAANGSPGSDSVGGTIDLRTVDPTTPSQFLAGQSLGTQGRASTWLQATGSEEKLSYALVNGVEGTYGAFPGASIAQTGLRGTDFTSATLGQLTYHVSGDFVLRNQLAKIVYAPTVRTKVTLSAYDATSWSDKTGEGDNDFNPYTYVLANAPVGASPACPRGVLVTGNDGPACLSPSAYAAAASGPAGGGPGAWQALRNEDYAARISSVAGKSDLALDLYTDQYDVEYHRDASLINGPLDQFLDVWSTQGMSLHDSINGRQNAFGFGLSWLRQTLSGNGTAPDGSTFVGYAPVARTDRSAFVNDDLAITARLSLRADAWLRSSSLDPVTHLDPQLTLLYRPRASDAFRLSGGLTTDEPSLETQRVNLLPIGALNPNCGALARATRDAPVPVNVGSGPASNLAAETGSDLEFGYEHRFAADGALGLTLYDANVNDRIVTGQFAAGSELPPSAVPALFSRIEDFCGLSPPSGAVTFTLNRSFNAAKARLRGIELSGHNRVAAHLSVHYAYDTQSIVLDGLTADVLRTDPTLVNGLQVFEVPLHKETLGIEFTTGAGLVLRLDGHAIGPNNPQQLPGYAYADASLEQKVSRHVVLALDASNVFDSHAQTYGLVGYGLPYATNAYNSANATPFTQSFNERYGLEPAALSLSAKLRI